MEITQYDRDKLRASQQKLLSTAAVGNITEHKTQNPKKYKQLSSPNSVKKEPTIRFNEMPKNHYKSKYLDTSSALDPIEEDLELGLPIDPSEVSANSWLNMNQVEFDKLEWMSDKSVKAHQERLKTTTLFDKDGRAIPPNIQPEDKTKEPVEGHDIDGLLNLLDSTYPPQVTYALITISRIANLTTMGYYDGAFDMNIHEVMLKKFFLRVRLHLDSSNESVCQNALKCLRALLCNTHLDEIAIDRVHPLISDRPNSNLWLQTSEMKSKEFTPEMKDHECIEIDAIRTLIDRTHILTKFCYLLDVKIGKSNLVYHECILDILVRIVRHSPYICCILNDDLIILNRVIKLFLPVNISSEGNKARQKLAVKALKLIRIIAEGILDVNDESFGDSDSEKVKCRIPDTIVTVIESYFFIDYYNLPPNQDSLCSTHLETLRLIKTLSKFNKFRGHMRSVIALGQDKLIGIFRTLDRLKPTKRLSTAISFDWQYAAHVIDLTGFVSDIEKHHDPRKFESNIWTNYMEPVLLGWITDLVEYKVIPHLDVSIAISAAVSHHRNRTDEKGKKKLMEVMIESIAEECRNGENVNQLNLFKLLARTATEKSQLPNFLKESGRIRDPNGLPSFGSLNYNTSTEYKFKLNPVFDNESPFILLNMLINNLKAEKSGPMPMLSPFVENYDLNRYIRCVTGYHKKSLSYEPLVQRSIMAQFEVSTISRSILLLGQYYLNYNDKEPLDLQIGSGLQKESQNFKEKRIECYNNLVYYAISAIGLLRTVTSWETNLTDQLFENVLLHKILHARVAAESFQTASKLDCRNNDQINRAEGGHFCKIMTVDQLNALAPLYISFKQLDRFWIFQPLIDYYMNRIRVSTVSDENKKLGNQWFKKNTDWKALTGELMNLNKDSDIISLILSFACSMIHCSPAYEHLIIRPNIEDYICIIGSIFLDDDLFFDEDVSGSIAMNLKALLTGTEQTGKLDSPFKDASQMIRPLNLLVADFFDKLINQFESVSYGHAAFANFLLLFVTPRSDKVFLKGSCFKRKIPASGCCVCHLPMFGCQRKCSMRSKRKILKLLPS